MSSTKRQAKRVDDSVLERKRRLTRVCATTASHGLTRTRRGLNVNDLREECKKREMPHTGYRTDLVKRLCKSQKNPAPMKKKTIKKKTIKKKTIKKKPIKKKQLGIYEIARCTDKIDHTYASAIVVASDKEVACRIHPEGYTFDACFKYDYAWGGSETVGRSIRFNSNGDVVEIAADEGCIWRLANGGYAKKNTRGITWNLLPHSSSEQGGVESVGRSIRFKGNGDIVKIVKDEGRNLRLDNKRIAKKNRRGITWDLLSSHYHRPTIQDRLKEWNADGMWVHPSQVKVTYLSGLSADTKLTEGTVLCTEMAKPGNDDSGSGDYYYDDDDDSGSGDYYDDDSRLGDYDDEDVEDEDSSYDTTNGSHLNRHTALGSAKILKS